MAWNELVSVSTQIHIATSRRRNKHAQKHCQWQCTPATPHSYFDAQLFLREKERFFREILKNTRYASGTALHWYKEGE